MVLNTASVSLAVTPKIISTFFSHYLYRSNRKERPTAHLPYDEGLHLVRAFLIYASHHTVEEVQAFMSQWVPAPAWIRVEVVAIPDDQLGRAAVILERQLGSDGIRRVGGRKWWRWRKPQSVLNAEWIEMKSLYAERHKNDPHHHHHHGHHHGHHHKDPPANKPAPARRVMLYVHGGAYYMGSVDEHRYQMQRHARKLKARVFAPRYRLAPQFPFPCGLHDCLAAYLHLLRLQDNDPSTIVLAGDSAGGGMVLSLLVIMRDQGIPLPAGAILISPWVDLTHSFPSLSIPSSFDYIPPYGFHQRPSMAWPPPSEDVLRDMYARNKKAHAKLAKAGPATTPSGSASDAEAADMDAEDAAAYAMFAANNGLKVLDSDTGETFEINQQIQMYTTNNMLSHPLVSPALQPTLGGLPPLLVLTGGGEILRDEQIYLAHKCADPARYAPPSADTDPAVRAQVHRYPPTDVQLQVWDDLCHVAPTLSFTRPAKYMFRSIAQFGAWALSRAQNAEMEDFVANDDMSIISESSSSGANEGEEDDEGEQGAGGAGGGAAAPDTEETSTMPRAVDVDGAPPDPVQSAANTGAADTTTTTAAANNIGSAIGKAGDPLPPFTHHMIRQRVTRHGVVYPLAPASELPGPRMALDHPSHVGIPKRGPADAWLAAKQQWETRYARDSSRVLKQRLRDAAVGFESFGPGEHPPPSALAARIKIGADMADKGGPHKLNRGIALWSLWGSKHDELTVEREGAVAAETGVVVGKAAAAVAGGDSQTTSADVSETDASNTADADHPPVSVGGTALKAHESTFIGASGKRPFVGGIASPFSLNKEADSASMVTLHSMPGDATETPAGGAESSTAPAK